MFKQFNKGPNDATLRKKKNQIMLLCLMLYLRNANFVMHDTQGCVPMIIEFLRTEMFSDFDSIYMYKVDGIDFFTGANPPLSKIMLKLEE